jgi:hypothetical protein
MSRVVYYCAASLDEFIAETDDTIGWLTGYEGEYEGEGVAPVEGAYDNSYEGVGALVSGAVSYEFVRTPTRTSRNGRAGGPDHCTFARGAEASGLSALAARRRFSDIRGW